MNQCFVFIRMAVYYTTQTIGFNRTIFDYCFVYVDFFVSLCQYKLQTNRTKLVGYVLLFFSDDGWMTCTFTIIFLYGVGMLLFLCFLINHQPPISVNSVFFLQKKSLMTTSDMNSNIYLHFIFVKNMHRRYSNWRIKVIKLRLYFKLNKNSWKWKRMNISTFAFL